MIKKIIKYKAKGFDDKWYYGVPIMYNGDTYLININQDFHIIDLLNNGKRVIGITLCPYIGDKDYYGNDIYLNDIFEKDGETYRVIDTYGCYYGKSLDGKFFHWFHIAGSDTKIKVIGNILDNDK